MDPAWREKAQRLLIAKYFESAERIALYTLAGLPIPSEDEIARDARYTPTEARQQGREARFRLTVVAAYNYTCALTGYRLTTIASGSIVDAAPSLIGQPVHALGFLRKILKHVRASSQPHSDLL